MNLRIAVPIAFLLGLALTCAPAFGQQPSAPTPVATQAIPDVLVLVLSGVLPTPADGVSITYSGKISEEQAKADLKFLVAAGGWQGKASRTSTVGGTTAAEFQAVGIVSWDRGILPIEPFIRAYKRFGTIQINYVVPGAFPFRSLRDYSDRYVDIRHTSSYGTYVYGVRVKDASFDRLNLPLIVEPGQPAQPAQPTEPKPRGSRLWIAVVVAAVAGGAAFLIVSRFTWCRKEQ